MWIIVRPMEKQIETSGLRPQNFRIFLQQELVGRCQKNPKYSLRAFAKALSVGPSALSDMLNGKRTITKNMTERLGLALGLSPDHIEAFFRDEFPSDFDSDKAIYRQHTLDTFAIISDWYHYAILALMRVKDFKPTSAWVAKSLGISKPEANLAIERLVRVGLLRKEKDGKWLDTTGGFSTNINGNLTSAANKKLQKQILELAIKALEEVPSELRDYTSMTMAIDPKYLPEAVEKIKKFRRGLAQFLEERSEPTAVYNLGISLYPLTFVPMEMIDDS
jgi:uncharacterized protein (TIGR02147 family)